MRDKIKHLVVFTLSATIVLSAIVLPQTVLAAGACCLLDGTCQSVLDQAACTAVTGHYWGDGTACSDAGVCTGACATTDFLTFSPGCFDGTVNQCANAIGNFVGFQTSCANDVCAQNPYVYPVGGEFNISGATLFADFFGFPAATNDFINVDGDVTPCAGTPLFAGFADTNCDTFADAVDQLAPNWTCSCWNGHWLTQYRSVGSGNGLAEFVDWQLLNQIPTEIPSERGLINRTLWADTGLPINVGCVADCFRNNRADMNCDGFVNALDIQALLVALVEGEAAYNAQYSPCGNWNPLDLQDPSPYLRADFDGDVTVAFTDAQAFVDCVLAGGCDPIETGTPVCPSSIDIANMDVPTKWFTRTGDATTAQWNQTPTSPGYGHNPNGSSDTGFSNKLKTLARGVMTLNTNTNPPSTPAPDANTVFDTTVAYSPVVPIANRGTGMQNVSFTALQYHFITGRLPSGENLTAVTRDSGSGTRNAFINSLGIDPSWGMGDNLGSKTKIAATTNLGPDTQPTNCGGSSIMENSVQQRRLGLGYTGLFGGSRAAADAAAGKFEILNVIKDTAGGTVPVRPSVAAVLHNANVDSGWQIGGSQTFATRGDPMSNGGGGENPVMSNLAARDYIRNLMGSITAFIQTPQISQVFFMPAELLVQTFVLDAAVAHLPSQTAPDTYLPNPAFNINVQTEVEMAQITVVPPFGSVNPGTGLRVPQRNNSAYDDGCPNNYADFQGNCTISSSAQVMGIMAVQGDWNGDGNRDINDICIMMVAYHLKLTEGPTAFSAHMVANNWAPGLLACCPALASLPNGNPGNYIVPEITGDYDGDGNFTTEDIRYYADGLALVGGLLNRQQGFEAVDTAWLCLTGNDNNFFDTIVNGAYVIGDTRFDVAGNSLISRGAAPTGSDGVVNQADVNYVTANVFTNPAAPWGTVVANQNSELVDHSTKDLSCDMSGDLIVNTTDVTATQAKAL